MVLTQPSATRAQRTKPPLIDCDIHNELEGEKALFPYLSSRWVEHIKTFGLRGTSGASYPRFQNRRADSAPPSGRASGADPAFTSEQLLDEWNIAYGVLNPLTSAGRQLEPTLDAALCQAVNDWQVAEWLEADARYRASIVIPYEHPAFAVAEIERRARDRRFVQVQFMGRTREPMGRRKYWPIYEACAKHNLAVMSHAFGSGGTPITGAGWPSYYIEDHVGPAQSMQANLISLALEGVFEEFPSFRFISAENGFAWFASMSWRLDDAWSLLKAEVPSLKRAPSEYLKEHVWLCTQPMEEPEKPAFFHQMMRQIDGENRLVLATDYPHWDWDAPDQALPVRLPADVQHKIFFENARRLYDLPPIED